MSEIVPERVEQLERRVARERRSRREAEEIAERGMSALYRTNVDLDRRISERDAALEDALAAANAASSALRSVLVGLSHSLATPLNGIRGMLELLEESSLEEPARSWHASATRSAARLDRLVARLVRYVELDTPGVRQERRVSTLRALLFGVEERWATRLATSGQLLVVDGGPAAETVVASCDSLGFVLDELLDNVRQHAEPGQVSLTTAPEHDDMVTIELTDAGPGFTAVDASPPAADPLTRAGDHGSQLGLVMIDRLLEGMGGRRSASAERSSTVRIELPVIRTPR